ncbi:MAG: serine/threonine-protein kinase, partial [Planctomycetota bacterium]|nr:serine/threonine-protein kinase [Planctomycetota bacterium]
MPDEKASPEGKVIGGCRIAKLLGGGAMGSVYRAHHLNLKKDVAIKIMAPSLAGQTQYVQRFVSEARLAAQIEHPNIVQVLNVGRQESVYYIVMQYIEGESVMARLMRDGPLPPLEAARIGLGIARGLAAAHAKGIIHRDIKPANVLLTRTGEVKVADLGLAKATLGIEDSALTQVGETMGTPQYMPTEQAEDARSADARSDIYSLGCTLYHMLVGTPPFSAKTVIAVLKKQISELAPPVAKLRPEVPKELSDLVARMMAKQREERPQTAAEVADALQGICEPRAAAAGSLAGDQAARRGRAFPCWAVAAGVGAALLLLIVLDATQHTPAQKAFEAANANWTRNPAAYTAALA